MIDVITPTVTLICEYVDETGNTVVGAGIDFPYTYAVLMEEDIFQDGWTAVLIHWPDGDQKMTPEEFMEWVLA